MNLHRGLLVAVLLLGSGLRVWGLTDHGLWIDEYGTWWAVAGDGLGDVVDRVLAIHGQSPLYYLVVRAFVGILGPGELSLRLPSLLAGLGLLGLAHPLALRLFRDREVALLAVAAVAVNEHLVYSAQEARPYALAILCSVGSFHAFVALLDGGGARARVGYLVATALAWYVHYLFGIVVLAQGLYWLARRPWREGPLRPWLASFAALGLLMAPGLVQLASLFARRQSLDWIVTPAHPLQGLRSGLELLDPWALAAIGLGLAVGLIVERRLVPLARGSRPGLVALWFAVPILTFAVVAPLLGINLLHARYLVIAVPAVPLAHAALMGAAPRRPLLRVLPLAAFLCVAVGLRIEPLVARDGGRFWWFLQHDWQGAVTELRKDLREGDLVLYRTGFVEQDLVLAGRASPMTAEFAGWPVLAHLPSSLPARLAPLAYRSSPENDARISAILERERPRRIWVLGLDPVDPTSKTFGALVDMARQGRPVRVAGVWYFGVVHLIRLEPPGAPSAARSRSRSGRP